MFIMQRGFEFTPGYRLEAFLGEGQFGQVWRVSAPGGTVAAVKFVHLAKGQWQREYDGIRRVKNVQHPNLMPITAIWFLGEDGLALHNTPVQETATDTAEFDDLMKSDQWSPSKSVLQNAHWLAFAMLLGGNNLEQCLKQSVSEGHNGIPPKELLGYIGEAAKGIDFLNSPVHDFGTGPIAVQHCDIKPANIVLLGTSAVVCDFGVARILGQDQILATSLAGTAAYMPPEAIEQKPSRTSDQYALAITYYHLRTNRLPFASESFLEVLRAHQAGSLSFDDVAPEVRKVLKKATALEWTERFDSCQQMVEALRDAEFPRLDIQPPIPIPPPKRWKTIIATLVIAIISAVFVLSIVPRWLPDKTSVENGHEIQGDEDESDTEVPKYNPQEFAEVLRLLDDDQADALRRFESLYDQYEEVREPNHILIDGVENDMDKLFWLPPPSSSSVDKSVLVAYGYGSQLLLTDFSPSTEQVLEDRNKMRGRSLNGHMTNLEDFEVSATRPMAASADQNGTVLIWSLDDLGHFLNSSENSIQPIGRLDLGTSCTAVSWHPIYEEFLCAADFDANIHVIRCQQNEDAVDLELVKSFQLDQYAKSLDFFPRGTPLVCKNVRGQLLRIDWIEIEDSIAGNQVPQAKGLSSKGSGVNSFKIFTDSEDRNFVATAGEDGEISVYTPEGDIVERLSGLEGESMDSFELVNSPNGLTMAGGGESGRVVLEHSGARTLYLTGHNATVSDICISADQAWLATCSWDKSIIVRNIVQDEPTHGFRIPAQLWGSLLAVEISSDNRWLVASAKGKHLHVWDFRHVRLLALSKKSRKSLGNQSGDPTEPPAVNEPQEDSETIAKSATNLDRVTEWTDS